MLVSGSGSSHRLLVRYEPWPHCDIGADTWSVPLRWMGSKTTLSNTCIFISTLVLVLELLTGFKTPPTSTRLTELQVLPGLVGRTPDYSCYSYISSSPGLSLALCTVQCEQLAISSHSTSHLCQWGAHLLLHTDLVWISSKGPFIYYTHQCWLLLYSNTSSDRSRSSQDAIIVWVYTYLNVFNQVLVGASLCCVITCLGCI